MEPPSELRQYSPGDFLFGSCLGEGRFGTVVYAEIKTTVGAKDDAADDQSHGASSHQRCDRQQKHGYAIKMIPKSEIFRHNQLQAVMTEKHILSEILSSKSDASLPGGSELFMKLFLCFHDTSSLYLVLELCAGGTLFDLIQSRAGDSADASSPLMESSWVTYYAAQILRAIEYLHQRGVVHRDISPRNIGLTFPNGAIKLGDFGSAAIFVKDERQGLKRWRPGDSNDFVGTADYVSPEMIQGNDHSANICETYSLTPAIDLWSFGCIVYQVSVGTPPFHEANEHLAFQSVLDYSSGKSELFFPPCITEDAKDIVSLLLSIDPASRLGIQDGVIDSMVNCCFQERGGAQTLPQKQYQSIRDHPLFQIDKNKSLWTLLESNSMEPPHKPTKPDWMTELHQGGTTLKSLESIQFDL